MAHLQKDRLKEATINVTVCGVFAVIALIVISIVGIWVKDIWSSPIAMYVVFFVLIGSCGIAALLGVVSTKSKELGFVGFVGAMSAGIICFVIGIALAIEGVNIYLVYVGSSIFITVFGYFKTTIDAKGYEEASVYMLIAAIINAILIIVFTLIKNVNGIVVIIPAIIEAAIFIPMLVSLSYKKKLIPFYHEKSLTIDVEEETEEEAELRRKIKAINKDTKKQVRKNYMDAFLDGSKERKQNKGRSGKYDGYSSSDWCALFEKKLNCGFVYNSVDVEAHDYASGANLIVVEVTIHDSGDDSHTVESGVNLIKSRFHDLERKCPYECQLKMGWY